MAEQPFKVNRASADYLIILLFGGDNNLSHFVYQDLQEMAAGLSGNTVVLGLADLIDRPASVVEVSPEHGIQTLEDMGEVDTGDPEVLANFVARALSTHPTAKRALGFWDHGTGIFDETDASEKLLTRSLYSVTRSERSRSYPARRLFFPKSAIREDPLTRGMLHDETNGGVLTNLEAASMVDVSLKRAGVQGRFDLIFSDTCLNGMIEVLQELGPYADCVVGSPELEPGDGWNYENWLTRVGQQPPASGAEWGQHAVEAFKISYEPYPRKYPCTLAAYRTEHKITDAFTNLVKMVRADEAPADAFYCIDRARSTAQAYARRDTYDMVDFGHKLVSVAETSKPALADAGRALIDACETAKVHSCRLGTTVEESYGLAFWFPSSRSMMRRDVGTYDRLTFSKETGWGELLRQYR